jgi:hypothetical protein
MVTVEVIPKSPKDPGSSGIHGECWVARGGILLGRLAGTSLKLFGATMSYDEVQGHERDRNTEMLTNARRKESCDSHGLAVVSLCPVGRSLSRLYAGN